MQATICQEEKYHQLSIDSNGAVAEVEAAMEEIVRECGIEGKTEIYSVRSGDKVMTCLEYYNPERNTKEKICFLLQKKIKVEIR